MGKGRGCSGILPLFVLLLGAVACLWSLGLGFTRGGDTVSTSIGLSFWGGWICGIALVGLGIILGVIQRLLGIAGNAADKLSGGGKKGGLDDLLPDIPFLNQFLGR